MQNSLKYCTKCLMPDTRPNIKFVDGICTACINFEKQKTTDWKKRLGELKALCDKGFSFSSLLYERSYENESIIIICVQC